MMIVAGFGWAKPVPVSTRNFKSPRKDELIVSLAGITVNLILGVAFMIIWIVLICLPWSNEILNTMVLLYHKLWPCGIQSAAHSAA